MGFFFFILPKGLKTPKSGLPSGMFDIIISGTRGLQTSSSSIHQVTVDISRESLGIVRDVYESVYIFCKCW